MDSLDVFEVLVRENARMVTAYVQASVPTPAAVDDIWQETMFTAWKRWSDYDRSRPFGAWLRGIARKKILAWQRQAAREYASLDQATLDYVGSVFSRIQQLEGDRFEEKLEALRACIQALPDSYQHVVRLRYEDALMPAAIADRQEKPLETVKKQLQRARGILHECLNRKLALLAPES